VADHTVPINQKLDDVRPSIPQAVKQEDSSLNTSFESNAYKGMKIKQEEANAQALSVGKMIKQGSQNSQMNKKYSDYDLSRLSAMKQPAPSGINPNNFLPEFSPINAPQDTFNFNTINLDGMQDFLYHNDNPNQGHNTNNSTNPNPYNNSYPQVQNIA